MSIWAGLQRHIPILSWARAYSPDWLRTDLLAGVTTAAVVLPKAMGYAAIAGLPVKIGLYTALVTLPIYAIFGTSRVLSVTTTTTLAILAAAQIGSAASGAEQSNLLASVATLCVLTGLMLIVAFVLRMGFVAKLISEPVLTGFKAGVGIVIIVDQIPKILGIHFAKTSFVRNVLQIITHLPETLVPALVLGVGTLVLILFLERRAPRIPAPLIAVALGIVCIVAGLRDMGVATADSVEPGLPELAWPDWSLARSLWPGALGIALMSFTESVAAMRAFSKAGEPRPEPNQELLALGLSNIGAGFFGGMPAGGGATQTAVNRRAGARTQLSGLTTAAASLASLLLLAPLIGLIPQATLAAIVIAYSVGLISVKEFLAIRRIRTTEFWWAVIAVVGITALGTLNGILVAVIASLASLIQQTNNPPVYALGRIHGTDVYGPLSPNPADDETEPGLLIVRVEGRIYFANSEWVADKIHQLIEQHRPKVLILDCRAIFDFEISALKMLEQAEASLRAHGITLWLVAPNPGVLHMLERAPIGRTLGKERIFPQLHPTVEHYKAAQKHN